MTHFDRLKSATCQSWAPKPKKMANPKFPPQYAYEMSHSERKGKPCWPGRGTGTGPGKCGQEKQAVAHVTAVLPTE